MDTKSWVSLKKKVDKLDTKFKGANIVVLGVVGRQLMSAGVAEINLLEEYRNGVLGNIKESIDKSGRRNLYRDDSSCPEWWKGTSVPFQSVNKPGQDGKMLTMVQLMELTESLQQHTGVIPLPPVFSNRTSYNSRFVDFLIEEGSTEQVFEGSTEQEFEGENIPEQSG